MTLLLISTFAFVVGLNDGSPLVALAAAAGRGRPWVRVCVLAVATALVPTVVGTSVAATYARGIADFEAAPSGRGLAVAAVVVATLVVFTLHRLHRPTSLTLALIGALAGVAVGGHLAVTWWPVARVIALGLSAPVVAAALGFAIARSLRLTNRRSSVGSLLRRADLVGFAAQSFAYSLNDGQKVLLLPIIVLGAGVTGGIPVAAAVCVGYAAGTALGLPRARRAASVIVVPGHSRHLVASEFASAVMSLGGAALGTPLSMGQTCAGANVGSGAADGLGRVRWSVAGAVAGSWALTLPAAALAGMAAATALLWTGAA